MGLRPPCRDAKKGKMPVVRPVRVRPVCVMKTPPVARKRNVPLVNVLYVTKSTKAFLATIVAKKWWGQSPTWLVPAGRARNVSFCVSLAHLDYEDALRYCANSVGMKTVISASVA